MKLWIVICLIVAAATWVGGAHGAVVEGTPNGDVLNGTAYADKLYGYGGGDTLNAKSGADLAEGGSGPDTLDMGCGHDDAKGNGGEDLIYVDCADGKGDVVDCGSEDDIVFWRVAGTVIAPNCEDSFRVTSSNDADAILYTAWFDSYEEFGGP